MKKNYYLMIFLVLLITTLLSACVGAGPANSSWPGLALDSANQVAYLANNQFVIKLNLQNGSELGKFPVEAQKNVLFYASPALSGDNRLALGSYDKQLYFLDTDTLQQVWVFNQAKKRYIASPLATDQAIYAPNDDGTLYALDKDGNLLWKFATDEPLWATPATDGENIYLASMDHQVYAINAQTGIQVWKSDKPGGTLTGGPTLGADGKLYIGTFGSEMLALDAKDGSELWRISTTGWVWSAPALADGALYFGDLSGALYAVAAKDGKILWQNPPDGSSKPGITGTPLVSDGIVYVGTESGNLFAYKTSDGSRVWYWPLDPEAARGKIFAGPQLAGDLILITQMGTRDSFVVALNKTSGAQQWAYPPKISK